MKSKLYYAIPVVLAIASCAPRIGSNDYSYSSVR